jgi:hypothetical protein
MTHQPDPTDGTPQVTLAYLQSRAAHYRLLMAKAEDPRRVNRYRELSELLDEAAKQLDPRYGPATANRDPT